ncbi:hypothetical protein [Candidatus Neptunochlamydia vexilliferae]|uniref:hypothetical protein n=1 Tax=Candidatus Neptunichlamydia vexilliferae TaxID=1651774 RepID=UPI001890D44B|nr:hypothetical protein [Candidatus Neptunochlamydia vexilliferae]
MNKRRHGIEVSRNFRGTKFKRLKYILPKVEVGSLVFKNPLVTALSKKQRDASIIYLKKGVEKSPPQNMGDVGRKFLKNVNLLFDIKKSVIIATNDRDRLAKEGYEMESFVKIPFKQIYKGIILKIKTDLGELKLGLDTGTTWTLLRDSLHPKNKEKQVGYHGLPVMTTNKYMISGTDFGPQNLAFIEITDKLRDIDGFLGMDFIQNHVIYVDFSKKILYIEPPNQGG